MSTRFSVFVSSVAVAAMLLAGGAWHVQAAQLSGVSVPTTQSVGNTTLVLNGIGLRTYSIFAVKVYVAALYLQQPSHDGNAILASGGDKILLLHFVRDVSVEKVRDAWRKGLLRACAAPCEIKQGQLSMFLNALWAVHAGEIVKFVFSPDGVHVYDDQETAGYIPDLEFARVMLAMFIGQHATVPQLRQELLGLQPSGLAP
jgi:hypothetical protein